MTTFISDSDEGAVTNLPCRNGISKKWISACKHEKAHGLSSWCCNNNDENVTIISEEDLAELSDRSSNEFLVSTNSTKNLPPKGGMRRPLSRSASLIIRRSSSTLTSTSIGGKHHHRSRLPILSHEAPEFQSSPTRNITAVGFSLEGLRGHMEMNQCEKLREKIQKVLIEPLESKQVTLTQQVKILKDAINVHCVRAQARYRSNNETGTAVSLRRIRCMQSTLANVEKAQQYLARQLEDLRSQIDKATALKTQSSKLLQRLLNKGMQETINRIEDILNGDAENQSVTTTASLLIPENVDSSSLGQSLKEMISAASPGALIPEALSCAAS